MLSWWAITINFNVSKFLLIQAGHENLYVYNLALSM